MRDSMLSQLVTREFVIDGRTGVEVSDLRGNVVAVFFDMNVARAIVPEELMRRVAAGPSRVVQEAASFIHIGRAK